MLFDTHCHLNYLKQAPTSEIIKKSLEMGVMKMVCIATDPDNLDEVLSIALNHPGVVYCSQGIHPHDASLFNQDVADHISKNILSSKQVVAYGEIGLDYHYDLAPRDIQIKVFEKQMELAIAHNLPVIIHTREAEEDTWKVLSQYKNDLKKPLVLHSFTSHISLAEKAIDAGFYLGFNGIITFKNADNVREALKMTPIDKILTETDAPFLAPTPFRGKENAPFYLPEIAHYICDFKGLDYETTRARLFQNGLDFFSIS